MALQNTCTAVGYFKSCGFKKNVKLDCSEFGAVEINRAVDNTYINYQSPLWVALHLTRPFSYIEVLKWILRDIGDKPVLEWRRKKQWLSCWNEENMTKRKRVIAWSKPTHPWEFIHRIHFQGNSSTETYPHVFWRQYSVFEFELLEPKSITSSHLPLV